MSRVDATADDPEGLARVIANRILARFGSQTGLLGSGRIGVNWDLQESAGARYYLVRELRSGQVLHTGNERRAREHEDSAI